jgi:hypothetical protein
MNPVAGSSFEEDEVSDRVGGADDFAEIGVDDRDGDSGVAFMRSPSWLRWLYIVSKSSLFLNLSCARRTLSSC